jgi:hypothetical protein
VQARKGGIVLGDVVVVVVVVGAGVIAWLVEKRNINKQ